MKLSHHHTPNPKRKSHLTLNDLVQPWHLTQELCLLSLMQIIFHQKVSRSFHLSDCVMSQKNVFFLQETFSASFTVSTLCQSMFPLLFYLIILLFIHVFFLLSWCTCMYLVDKTSLFLPPKISLKQISYAQFETDTNVNIYFWFTCMQVTRSVCIYGSRGGTGEPALCDTGLVMPGRKLHIHTLQADCVKIVFTSLVNRSLFGYLHFSETKKPIPLFKQHMTKAINQQDFRKVRLTGWLFVTNALLCTRAVWSTFAEIHSTHWNFRLEFVTHTSQQTRDLYL